MTLQEHEKMFDVLVELGLKEDTVEDIAPQPVGTQDVAPQPVGTQDVAPQPVRTQDVAPQPVRTQDVAPKAPKYNDPFLANILVSNELKNNTISLIMLGESGIGKTYSLKGLNPKSTLILDIDNGLAPIMELGFNVIPFYTFDPFFFGKFVNYCVEGKLPTEIKTVVIDSISLLSEMALTFYKEKSKNNNFKPFGDLKDFFNSFLYMLQKQNNYNVVFTCGIHLNKDYDEFGNVKMAEYKPLLASSSLSDLISYHSDVILTLAFQDPEKKEFENKDRITGETKKGKPLPVNKYQKRERVFITSRNNNLDFPAKDRTGKLNNIEPASLSKIFNKIFQGATR